MDDQRISRRLFIIESSAGLSSAWFLSHLPDILAAQDHAHRAARSAAPLGFEVFTAEQAVEVEAIAAQIIPTDSTPGAREARVVYFIDRALATFAADQRKVFDEGFKQFQSKLRRLKTASFHDLSSERQIKFLKSIEKSDFFELIRTLTITGMFANPEYGGNHEQMGWKLIGFEDQFFFKPPFGFYDRGHHSNG
ncbi:MAG: gluconate 2-dehydrogenase subunit 3 family protein [Acidobacteriota bacterium]